MGPPDAAGFASPPIWGKKPELVGREGGEEERWWWWWWGMGEGWGEGTGKERKWRTLR